MARWRPDARERLQQAALELFAEQGFAATTVPAITARAGLTTRTFFRHFADKREVLFADEAEIPAFAAKLIAEAPEGQPLAMILGGLRAVAETHFEGRKPALRRRRAIVASDPGLRERDLHKRAVLAEVTREGFKAQGLDAVRAGLLAETAVTLMYVSVTEWLDTDDDRRLVDIIDAALATLRAELQ
ncbi:TetR/AcrR family transcriptional regulator [Dactylosporangium matsuzakiense]|uniref:TetR family transcriptional regulator n=1 Tax=Dactylosporangium matsuzakiense TaxID=53360 RepID=A0A9W6KFK6_9ACTN|nr:TetR/AcrR family transcriptional regulator [Dactylosporangium matsuzakiense]UWZ46688.1 TetR family transcriptional regulator [Dactylosporangium matsuzakiense]GLL01172.1 TetR family transcriptional regulator [Dactylosporangium matsuzakiense]